MASDKKRYLSHSIEKDVKRKMVLLGGPRQVGKTTLALNVFKLKRSSSAYLNWDIQVSRDKIKNSQWPPEHKRLVFDEIHKYSRWRNLAKGFYDAFYPQKQLIITGSARLDHYRKGGDSLLGRYYHYRLHPFSLRELNPNPNKSDLEALLKFGGFPEPFLLQNETELDRWQKQRTELLLREDIRDLENVKDINLLELLLDALPDRVGAPLSYLNLSHDLEVSPLTVKRWVNIFQNVYLVFLIAPYGAPKIRAVKKEQKLYFWDWASVSNPAARFENFVASQLLKFCHDREDRLGKKMELRFIRDTDKREVDFVVIENKKPIFAVECKSGERTPSPHIPYFQMRTDIPKFYQVHMGTKDYLSQSGVRVLPMAALCKELELP